MNRRKIVIVGGNYSATITMARSIFAPDREIILLNTGNINNNIKSKVRRFLIGTPIEQKSKFINKIIFASLDNPNKIIECLLNECINNDNKTILIPLGDIENSIIDSNYDKLKDHFIFPTISNKGGEIKKIMDKTFQKELAKKFNLNVAKNYNVRLEKGEYIIPKEIKYPVFIKPESSFLGKKTIMKKCSNKKELEEALETVKQTYNCPVLVEQFIEIENEYSVLGYSYEGETVIPGIIEMLKSGTGKHKGITLNGKVTALNKELNTKLTDFVSSLNFNGLFDIDLVKSQGKIYFVELNLRFGASGYAITKSGINLPNIYINKICGITNEPIKEIKEQSFISDKVNLEEFAEGNISWKEYIKKYENKDIRFMKSKTDPKVYKTFKRMEKYARLKRIIIRRKNNV